MDRLADGALTEAAHRVRQFRKEFASVMTMLVDEVDRLVTELRERRASDLTEEEREALREFRESFGGSNYPATWKAALAVLDKILGGKP